jgi:hypothetical protein
MEQNDLKRGTTVYAYDRYGQQVLCGTVSGPVPDSSLFCISLTGSFGEHGEKTHSLFGSVKKKPEDLFLTIQEAYAAAGYPQPVKNNTEEDIER